LLHQRFFVGTPFGATGFAERRIVVKGRTIGCSVT
jgi:hypothetical protein